MAPSNSQPGVVLQYCLESVEVVMLMRELIWLQNSFLHAIGGPTVLCCDKGTEKYDCNSSDMFSNVP